MDVQVDFMDAMALSESEDGNYRVSLLIEPFYANFADIMTISEWNFWEELVWNSTILIFTFCFIRNCKG